jgi:molybdopterin synthase catalytic subunit
MTVTVLLFASLKDAAGVPQLEAAVPENADVQWLLAHLGERFPAMARWASHVRVAVNQEYVANDHVLSEGDEVALIPPVSGGSGAVLVSVVDRELSLDEVVSAVLKASGGAAGAVNSFLGVVRRTSVDTSGTAHDDIEFLDYEAYAPMAERELRRICEEAAERWQADCAVTHRVGRLGLGEASVAIAVATAHRAESFEACRYIIEELKKRVPIWKKETAQDGFWWSEGTN